LIQKSMNELWSAIPLCQASWDVCEMDFIFCKAWAWGRI